MKANRAASVSRNQGSVGDSQTAHEPVEGTLPENYWSLLDATCSADISR